MTKPSLREVLGRLGPIRAIDLVRSGSPAKLELRPAGELARVNVPASVHALVRRGVRARPALDAIEQMLENGEVAIDAPLVEPGSLLAEELRDAGIEAVVVMAAVPA